MAEIVENEFTNYIFSDPNEEATSTVFSDLNYQHLRNQLAMIAQDKINLQYDPDDPNRFSMEHEYLRGSMNAIKYLLTLHEVGKTKLQSLESF